MAVVYQRPHPDKIISWIEKNIVNFKYRKNKTEITINNPFDGDTGHNFNISLSKAACFDWRGNDWAPFTKNNSGKRNVSFYTFVQLFKGISYYAAVREVGGTISARRIEEKPEEKPLELIDLPSGSKPINDSDLPKLASVTRNYLLSRGFNDYIIDKYRFMHCCTDIVVPYYEYGELVYWQTRSNINKRFEFPSETTGYKKSDYIYGFDNIEPGGQVILTEAIFCAVSIDYQSGALGGDTLSSKQVKKLRVMMPNDVTLAVDNDIPGIKSILSNGDKLQREKFKVKFVIPPKIEYGVDELGKPKYTKDWNDLLRYAKKSPKEVRDYIGENAKELTIRERFNISSMLRG